MVLGLGRPMSYVSTTSEYALHPQGGQDGRHGNRLPKHPAMQHHLEACLPTADNRHSVHLPPGVRGAPDHRGIGAHCALLVSSLVRGPKEG